MGKNFEVSTMIRLSENDKKRLVKAATEQGRKISDQLRWYIKRGLDQDKVK